MTAPLWHIFVHARDENEAPYIERYISDGWNAQDAVDKFLSVCCPRDHHRWISAQAMLEDAIAIYSLEPVPSPKYKRSI